MGLLTIEERDRLMLYLSRLPGIQSDAVRNSLLSGVPNSVRLQIQAVGIPATDLSAPIDTIDSDALPLEDGSWPIAGVINNAARSVEGTITAQRLRQLLTEAQARQASPARGAGQPNGASAEERTVNTRAVRELVTTAMSDSELTTLAFDYFRP